MVTLDGLWARIGLHQRRGAVSDSPGWLRLAFVDPLPLAEGRGRYRGPLTVPTLLVGQLWSETAAVFWASPFFLTPPPRLKNPVRDRVIPDCCAWSPEAHRVY